MLKTEMEIQNIDEGLIQSIFPSLEIDDWLKYKKSFSFQQQKDFFQKYIKDHKDNSEFSSIIHINGMLGLPNQYSMYFDVNETNFYISYPNLNDDEIEREKEIFSKTKSKYIIHPDIYQTKDEIYFQYFNVTTIHNLIKRNQKEHIINETDKLVWCLQICYAMSDIYNESNNSLNYNFYHGNISDETFCIDTMKNVYLFNVKPNARHQYFKYSEIDNSTQNININDSKKKADLYSCGILFEEILKESLPDEETFTNGSIQWYRNHHSDFDRILNKFPNRKNIYTEFQQIIHDLKSTMIYKYKENEINARLNMMETNKYSFNNLIFLEMGGVCDITPILRELLIKLRDQTKKGSNYYLFFNLLLHIFLPNSKLIDRKIDYAELFNLFNIYFNLQNSIDNILAQYLPNDEEIEQIIQIITDEINLIDQEINMLYNFKEIIKTELKGKDDDNKDFKKLLQKIYYYYFPYIPKERSDIEIFDYFGILYFLKNKNDIFHIVYPQMNERNIEKLNNFTNETNLKSFLTKTNSYVKKFCVLDFADKFDSSHLHNRLFYSIKNSCFYLNRKFQYDEYEKFAKMVQYQDELFMKINSKYILHIDSEENNVKHNFKSSTSNIPFVPTTLLHLIRKNDQHRIINDSDKILWAIQIAKAFRDLQNYQNQNEKQNSENLIDFKSCIYDQSFFIDSMKNIYLGTLVYCTEQEIDDAVTTGPVYFRSANESSYIYTYGVLLNEIITEIEPKNLFGNKSRYERKEVLSKGYYYFDKFNEVGHEWYEHYGDDIKYIVDKCILKEIDDFDEIIELLKKTTLYKKYKYIVDYREENAQRIDWSRKATIKTLLLSEMAGLSDMSQIFQQFIKGLNENCNEDENQSIYNTILNELKQSNNPNNHFRAMDIFLKNLEFV